MLVEVKAELAKDDEAAVAKVFGKANGNALTIGKKTYKPGTLLFLGHRDGAYQFEDEICAAIGSDRAALNLPGLSGTKAKAGK